MELRSSRPPSAATCLRGGRTAARLQPHICGVERVDDPSGAVLAAGSRTGTLAEIAMEVMPR